MEVRISRILAPVAEHQAQPRPFNACCWPWILLCVGSQDELYLTCLIGGVDAGFLIKGFGGKKKRILYGAGRCWFMRVA